VARACGQGRDRGWGKSPAVGEVSGWSGPVGGRALARLAGVGIIGQVTSGRCPSMGQNMGGERRERDREKARIQIKVSQNFKQILKKF
jgi:hypothetical protein